MEERVKARHPHSNLVDLKHPANAPLLAHFRSSGKRSAKPSLSPDRASTWRLGTHPDLVEHLWFKVTAKLPDTCHWVCYGRPVLAHPATLVIFGLAGGTNTLALRLPDEARQRAAELPDCGPEREYPDTTIYASDFGDDWIIMDCWGRKLTGWCKLAYEYAGGL